MKMRIKSLTILLDTPRLILRPLAEDDLDAVFRIFGDEATTAGVSWRHPSREFADVWLNKRLVAERTYGLSVWVVELRSTHEVVGFCGFYPRGEPSVELGYVIHAHHWGKGFASEAVTTVMQTAMDADVAVYATIRPHNLASTKVAEKAGLIYRSTIEDERGILLVYANSVS